MGSYSRFRDGYKVETVYGTSSIVQATQTYSWGALSDKSVWPSPSRTASFAAVPLNKHETTDVWKNNLSLQGMLGMRAQNGVILWAGMGKCTTTGPVGGIYTHTIASTTDGSALPSFTMQHEATGTGATNWSTQFTGCKIGSLTLRHDMKAAPFLIIATNWIAQNAARVAYILDNSPILPVTANEQPYTNLTRTFDSIAIDGLLDLEIVVNNGLWQDYYHSWEGATYTGHIPKQVFENFRKEYQVKLTLHPSTIEYSIWDDLIVDSNTHSMVFTWTRSANDYIEVTFSNCQVVEHSLTTPRRDEDEEEEVLIIPAGLSIKVVDSIANGAGGGYPA